MKKIVRTVWISVLSGLAFLAACCAQNGLSKSERKRLVEEREQVERELSHRKSVEYNGYDVDEFMTMKGEICSLENKLDSINFRLGDTIDLDRNSRRRLIQMRIDSLNFLMEHYTPPCIYGSPEMMAERRYQPDPQLERYEKALKEAEDELDALNQLKEDPIESQPKIDPKEEKKVVPMYGAPIPPQKK